LFPLTYQSLRKSNINVLKKVVNKKAMTYKESPVRLVNGEPNETLDNIYLNGMFDQSYKSFDRTFNRHKHALLWVINDPLRPTEFSLRSLMPYTYDLVIDPDKNQVTTVILSYPDISITHLASNTRTNSRSGSKPDGVNQTIAESQHDSGSQTNRYAIWNATQHVNITTKKREIEGGSVETVIDYIIDDGNPNMVNPLGMLPFIWATTDFDIPEYPTPSALPRESVFINTLASDWLSASSLQGFGQLVLKYPKGSRVKDLFTGFNVVIELPQAGDPDAPATDADYINPNPDLAGMRDAVMEYAAAVLSDEGLEGATLADKNKRFASGFERLLASASVTEIREENIMTYTSVEKGIYDIINKYDQVNGTRMFKDNDSFQVQFKKPKILQSEMDKLMLIEKRIDLGLDEEHEKFIKDNPNVTEDDARDKLKRIKEEKVQAAGSFLDRVRGANGQEPGESSAVRD